MMHYSVTFRVEVSLTEFNEEKIFFFETVANFVFGMNTEQKH